jgi:hypothetical protein
MLRWSWPRFHELDGPGSAVGVSAHLFEPPLEGWVQVPGVGMVRVSPATEALVRLSVFAGLAEIREGMLEEWRYRLDVLADLEITCRYAQTPEGPVPVRTNWDELCGHIGLKTTARRLTPEGFDRVARRLREGRLAEFVGR